MYVASDTDETMFLREESNSTHCSQCGEALINREALHNHACLRQTQQNQWTCSTCGMNFGGVFYLKEHMKTHELHDADKQLDTNENYSSISQVKGINLFYKCALCGKQFATPGELERHVRCHSLSDSHTCSVCKKEFKLAESLDVHMWSHLKYMPTFGEGNQSSNSTNPVSSAAISIQAASQHGIDNGGHTKSNVPKIQVCEICNKSFRNASYFQLHLRTHTGDKTYSCQVCAKSFSCSWNLKTHLAVHRDEKPYSCSICGVGFKLKPNMQRHERSHQPHERLAAACRAEQMDGSNTNSSNLTALEQNGIGNITTQKLAANDSQQLLPDSVDGPCTCSFCGKMFSCAAQLKSHLSIHINSRPYSCSRCGMGFKVKANMLRHERLHENSGHPPALQPSMSGNGWNGLNNVSANLSADNKSDVLLTSPKHNSDTGSQSMTTHSSEAENTLSASNVLNVAVPNKGLDPVSYSSVGSHPSPDNVLKSLSDENSSSVMVNAEGDSQFLRFEASKSSPTVSTTSTEVLSRVFNTDRRHTCKICGKTYKQRCHLLSHMISHSDERPYVCDFCGKSFSLSWNLKTHLAVHNQEKPFSCSICGNSFKLKTALQRHERSHMNRNAQTAIHNPHSLTTLTSNSHNNNNDQITTDHKPQNSNQHCTPDKVPKPSSTSSNNTNHDYSYVCEICSQSFGSCDDLQIHLQLHTDKDSFSCNVCGKSFPLADTLKLHFACHSDLNLFTCDACGNSFRLKAGLSRHLRIHTGPMPFVCAFCGKSFLESSALKCHVRTHTGERPYPCDHCGKRFVDSGALKRHVRIHTGEKPYSCTVCEKRFTTSTQLQIHTQMHS